MPAVSHAQGSVFTIDTSNTNFLVILGAEKFPFLVVIELFNVDWRPKLEKTICIFKSM